MTIRKMLKTLRLETEVEIRINDNVVCVVSSESDYELSMKENILDSEIDSWFVQNGKRVCVNIKMCKEE